MQRLAIAEVLVGLAAAINAAEPAADPRLLSVFPPTVQAGATTEITLRGSALTGARALLFTTGGLNARILSSAPEPGGKDKDIVIVRAELTAGAGAAPQATLRVVAAQGVTNEVPIRLTPERVIPESSLQAPLSQFPALMAGRIAERGEVDTIWLEVARGETLSFECLAGTAAFDPSLTLAEPSGSWFDAARLNRIAFNDEPLHFPGLSSDAQLTHRFDTAGRYAIQVRAFSGQGGPDYTYQLRIARGGAPAPLLHPKPAAWNERQFTRALPLNWLTTLATRGGRTTDAALSAAAFQPAVADTAEPPVMTAPGVVEGLISKPGETHRIRLRVDRPQDLAIEVETPRATMPRFNPVVRLLAPEGGGEVVTNVYTKRNNNGLYMMKMIQAKSTFTLRSPGDYLLEIRDITSDVSADDFSYRVLVRPQIPHVGRIDIPEDHLNIEPGQAKPLTVNVEREEGFADLVLLSAEGLPPGVTATAGLANPVEKPPLPNGGRVERYTARPQTATLLFTAASDAPASELPATVSVYLRPVVKGRPGTAILVKQVPVMVIPRRPS